MCITISLKDVSRLKLILSFNSTRQTTDESLVARNPGGKLKNKVLNHITFIIQRASFVFTLILSLGCSEAIIDYSQSSFLQEKISLNIIAPGSISEGHFQSLTLQFDKPVEYDTIIIWSLSSQNSQEGLDYYKETFPITLKKGNSNISIPILIHDDYLRDENEEVLFEIYSVGNQAHYQSHNLQIDDSLPPIGYNYQSISSKLYHSCAIDTHGDAHCWGSNFYGQLGDGTTTNSYIPLKVPSLSNVIDIVTGDFHTCALLSDNSVKCWGKNNYGQLGNGTTTNSSSPVSVSGITNATSISLSASHTCALLSDSTLKCWGRNNYGQIGDSTTTDSFTPSLVSGLTNVQNVSNGEFHTCALLTDSTIKCWGKNLYGQLGDGSTTDSSSPITIIGISNAQNISAGDNHTCALLTDNTLKCWGKNTKGQLGNGTLTNSSSPISVTGISNAQSITLGKEHTCTIHTDNTIRCWGDNSYGKLGVNISTFSSNLPILVSRISDVQKLALATYHTCALLNDSSIKCWGHNINGQQGTLVNTNNIFSPHIAPWFSGSSQISISNSHMCHIKSNDGSIQCWGNNFDGRLGIGHFNSQYTPQNLSSISAKEIATGFNHTCALLTDDAIRCWGGNSNGQLGDGSTSNSPSPITVSGLSNNISQITTGDYFSCALLTNGTVKCWGQNSLGQLGDSTNTDSVNPVTVSGITNASQIISGKSHSCALLSDSTIKCWGSNSKGQLGDGTETSRNSPIPVLNISNALSISSGDTHTCALLNDNTAKCWGNNSDGQLGDGTFIDRNTPTAVSGLTNAQQLSLGSGHSCSFSQQEGVKCWGNNSDGQLGDGTTTGQNTPLHVTIVSEAINKISVFEESSCAQLKDEGWLCWGKNNSYNSLVQDEWPYMHFTVPTNFNISSGTSH